MNRVTWFGSSAAVGASIVAFALLTASLGSPAPAASPDRNDAESTRQSHPSGPELECTSGKRQILFAEVTYRSTTYATVESLAGASIDPAAGESWAISQPGYGFSVRVLILGEDGNAYEELHLEHVGQMNKLGLEPGWATSAYETCAGQSASPTK